MRRSTAVLLALGIIALLVWNSAGFFFQRPYYEYWDSAANSLSIMQAKHFAQLYGPYSRFGFHHPGPAFFYVQALGEWLFHDLWHVVPSPFQGQLLINLFLVTAFYVAALSVFAGWLPARRRWVFLCAALGLGILHFSFMHDLPSFYDLLAGPSAFLSVWSGHSVVLPFFCLLTVGTSVGAGRGRHLPLLVIAGGFLMEHVAEALFVGSTAVAAYLGLAVSCAQRQRASTPRAWLLAAWRAHPRAHGLAGGLLFLFALPMLLDLTHGRDSNFAAILRHAHEQANDRKSALRSLTYFLQYGAYAPYQPGRIDFGHYDRAGFLAYLRAHAGIFAGWLGVVALVLSAPFASLWTLARRRAETPAPDAVERDDARRFLAWGAVLSALAVALSLYWGTRQDGPMFYFNSWLNFAIYYFGALVAIGVLCLAGRSRPAAEASPATAGRRWPVARLAGVGAVALTGFLCADRLRIHEDDPAGSRAMHANIRRALALSTASHPAACNVVAFVPETWPMAVAVGMQIARAGEPFVTYGQWKIAFGAEHYWQTLDPRSLQAGLCPWYVLPAGTPRRGVPADAPVFALTNGAQLTLTPPGLDLSAATPAAEINFAAGGDSTELVLAGWSRPDAGGTWSEGRLAALAFRPQAVEGESVEVVVSGGPFLAPAHGLNAQRLRLFFCGKPIGCEQSLSAPGSWKFLVSAAAWNAEAARTDPVASLAFELPDAVSPASLDPGVPNGDARKLAVFFQRVRFRVVLPGPP